MHPARSRITRRTLSAAALTLLVCGLGACSSGTTTVVEAEPTMAAENAPSSTTATAGSDTTDAGGSASLTGTWVAASHKRQFFCVGAAIGNDTPPSSVAPRPYPCSVDWQGVGGIEIRDDASVTVTVEPTAEDSDDTVGAECTGTIDLVAATMTFTDDACTSPGGTVTAQLGQTDYRVDRGCLVVLSGAGVDGVDRHFDREGASSCDPDAEAEERFGDVGDAIMNAD